MKQFGFRIGLSKGIINIEDKGAGTQAAKRAVDLSEGNLYVKRLHTKGTIENKVLNEERILFSEDILKKLQEEFLTIQTYISNPTPKLEERIPKKILEEISEKTKENPYANIVLKDCEVIAKKIQTKIIENKNTLDYYVKEYLNKNYDLSTYPEELVNGVIRHFCSMYKAYQTDWYGEKPIIAYLGNFAGVDEERKHTEDKFGVYTFLATDNQFNSFISKVGKECYGGLKKISQKKKPKNDKK